MWPLETAQHLAVAAGEQDALEDDVVTVPQQELHVVLDERRSQSRAGVFLTKQDPAQIVLLDEGAAAPGLEPQASGDRALARSGIAADHDQAGFLVGGHLRYSEISRTGRSAAKARMSSTASEKKVV